MVDPKQQGEEQRLWEEALARTSAGQNINLLAMDKWIISILATDEEGAMTKPELKPDPDAPNVMIPTFPDRLRMRVASLLGHAGFSYPGLRVSATAVHESGMSVGQWDAAAKAGAIGRGEDSQGVVYTINPKIVELAETIVGKTQEALRMDIRSRLLPPEHPAAPPTSPRRSGGGR